MVSFKKKSAGVVTHHKQMQSTTGKVKKGNSRQQPRCLEIARSGIRTGGQFAEMMSALMSDVIEGVITPQVSNATVNAGGKLLKVVELQLKYGNPNGNRKVLDLIDIGSTEPAA